MIAQGLVTIDGETVSDAGRKIEPGQTLILADAAQNQLGEALTIMIHKPMGIVSSQPEQGQIPAVRLLTQATLVGKSPFIPNRDSKLAPAGRLDMDSRGLLILSEDGVVAKAVIGPASRAGEGIPRPRGRGDHRAQDRAAGATACIWTAAS